MDGGRWREDSDSDGLPIQWSRGSIAFGSSAFRFYARIVVVYSCSEGCSPFYSIEGSWSKSSCCRQSSVDTEPDAEGISGDFEQQRSRKRNDDDNGNICSICFVVFSPDFKWYGRAVDDDTEAADRCESTRGRTGATTSVEVAFDCSCPCAVLHQFQHCSTTAVFHRSTQDRTCTFISTISLVLVVAAARPSTAAATTSSLPSAAATFLRS